MDLISDFKLLWKLSDSDEPVNEEPIAFGVGAPHPRLHDTGLHWWGEETVSLIPCYRRQPIEGMSIGCSNKLVLQLRTDHGFILMASCPSKGGGLFSISIYYVLGGFRGAEWGIFYGREEETPLEWVKRVVLKRWPMVDVWAPKGPEPLQAYRIEDDRNLAFKVHRCGWYRLTLFEQNPRRFLIPNWRFEPINSYGRHRRYFTVRKIWGAGYDGDSNVLYPS